jgi:hypothetical protein
LAADDALTDRELLLQINERTAVLIDCKDDHEKRIRSLEGSFWKVIGLALVISFITGFFGGKINGGS